MPTKRTIYARCPRCGNRRRVVVHSDAEVRAARGERCKGCGGGKPVGSLPRVKPKAAGPVAGVASVGGGGVRGAAGGGGREGVVNVERLLRLAAHLETVPAEAFDMGDWAVRHTCGTTCCALGHACTIPEFAAAGLTLVWDADERAQPIRATPECRDDVGRLVVGFRAAVAFFGIEPRDARDLFDPERYIPDVSRPDADETALWASIRPADVADRIRELVRGHQRAAAAAEGRATE